MDNIKEIYTNIIDDPKDAMRGELDRDALFELAANIKANGLINPITVRPIGGRYEVVAGHRRLSACKIAGIIQVPCVVRELDEAQTFAVMAAENLEREDVNPVDEAIFLTRYMEKSGKTIAEVSRDLKRSEAYVRGRLAVGSMPDYMQIYLRQGLLKLGVALTLLEIEDDATRHMWTEIAVRDGTSIAQATFWVSDYKRQQLPGGVRSATPPDGYTPDAPRPVLFRCGIDGKEYDARLCRSLLIYEGNQEIFDAFVSAFRSPPSESESLPVGS
jgi:ParB/RepB/Spo0J family partition protein